MGLLHEVMDQLARVNGDSKDRLPELLNQALDDITTDMKTIVISTRPIDLSDTDRFAAIWDDPKKRNSLGQVVCIDVSGDEVSEYLRV